MKHDVMFLSLLTITSACFPTQPSPMPSGLPSKKCTNNMITVAQTGPIAKLIDVTLTTGSKRRFICMGRMATIALSTAAGPLAPITDRGTDTAMLTVTCNAAGTGWEYNGMVITAIKCSVTPPPCSYHEKPAAALPPAVCTLTAIATKCYTPSQATTAYETLGKGTVETRRGCEVLCDSKPQCTAFSFKDSGIKSSCVLLSTATPELCPAPTTIFLKQSTGCVARTDLMADFGVDPCIDQLVPSAFNGLDKWSICIRDMEKTYFTRAIDSCGRRFTIDNDHGNWIEKSGNMWEFVYKYTPSGFKSIRVPIVAASCVIAGGAKCPCQPLQQISVAGGYPAATDRINPCNGASSWLWWDAVNYPGLVSTLNTQWATTKALITCKAGMWMLRNEESDNIWGIYAAACQG